MADISTEELERIEREYHSGSDNITQSGAYP